MREKIIYDGRIDGSLKEVQEVVDFFLFENFQLPGIDFRVEYENQKQVWAIYPPTESNQATEKIINGFIDISTETISDDRPVHVRLVSCRQILDLLFFQLSQRIQAKFIIRDYPPDVVTTPWRELIAQAFLSPLSTTMDHSVPINGVNPEDTVKKRGTYRDLTEKEVKAIVIKCRKWQDGGGTIMSFYEQEPECYKFSINALKKWLKEFSPRPKRTRERTR